MVYIYKEKTLFEKIREALGIYPNYGLTIDDMRQRLKDAKSLFISYCSKSTLEYIERYYDERVDTLPDKLIRESFADLLAYENAKGTEDEQLIMMIFINKFSLTFAREGWLRNKAYAELNKRTR